MVLTSTVTPLWAQITQPKRVEFELNDKDDTYNVVGAGEQGIILFKKEEDRSLKRQDKWKFVLLDTALNQVGSREVILDNKLNFRGYDYDDGAFYLLFQKGEYFAEEYHFVRLTLPDFATTIYRYKNLVQMDLSQFEVKGGAAILGGEVNMRPVILYYQFGSDFPRVLPGFYKDQSRLQQVVTNTGANNFIAISTEKNNQGFLMAVARVYNLDGELITTLEISPKEDRSLLEGRIAQIKYDKTILAGTYAYRKRKNYSRGLYVAEVEPRDITIKYYNYGDLKNFFDYMKEKKQSRIKRKIKRRKIKGKKLKFSYKLYVHDIIDRGDNYILVGEAYYPVYKNRSPYYYGMYGGLPAGGPYSSRMTFDGYRYTHAVIIEFDKAGHILWDNSFEINDIKTYRLQDYVKVVPTDDKVYLLYIYNQVLKSKIIQGDEVLEAKKDKDLKLYYENDEVRHKDDVEGLENWYGNTLFAYGVQKIKNLKDQNVKLNRKVFFINKITVH